MNKKSSAFKVAISGLFIALTFVATYFIVIPIGAVGYWNIGDTIIMLAGIMFGPVVGALSAIGAAIADIALGYVIYAPFTLVVKAVEGLLCGLIPCFFAKQVNSPKMRTLFMIVGMAISGVVMPLGYFLSEWFILPLLDKAYGYAAAIVSLPANILQYVLSAVLATIVYIVLQKAMKNRNELEK